MDNCYECFLKVLSDYLHDYKSKEYDVDWSSIYDIAQKHQLAMVFYYQTKAPVFQSAYANQISLYCKRRRLLENLENNLKGIQYVFFKGEIISNLYSQPSLRSMGDTDVLIHKDQQSEVNRRLIEDGFELIKKSTMEWIYRKKGLLFEIHTALLHPEEERRPIVDYFGNPWGHVVNGQLDWNYHFLYLVVHLRHHLSGNGIGFRQFMDLAILTEKIDLDWSWIVAEADKLNLKDFLLNLLAFNEKWFQVLSPIEYDISENFYLEFTQYIFFNGVFGFDNPDNSNAWLTRRCVRMNSLKGARIINFVDEIFPPYDLMAGLYYCHYLEKFKWLLPFAWIHRFLHGIFNSKSRSRFKNQVLIRNAGVERKIELLKELGL